MKTIFKIVRGSIKSSGTRAVMTFVGVTLSVTLITLVCVICSSLLTGICRIESDPVAIKDYRLICGIFTFIASVMGCVMIFSAFSVGFSGRVRVIGLLTSAGASKLQKSMIVVIEALIYGVAAVIVGVPLGTLAAMLFYNRGASMIVSAGTGVGSFSPSPSAFLLATFLGLAAVLAASVYPMMKIRRISVMDSIYGRTKINISLRPGLFARLTERVFGYLGRLAGQNYDNNKGTYHGISLTLSGGTTLFYTVYSFFMYFFRYDSLDTLYGTNTDARAPTVWDMLFGFRLDGEYAAEHDPTTVTAFLLCMILALLFVAISLVCASGGASASMDRRRGELAMLKSVGMKNSELCRMMCIESAFLTFYSALYGLIGALAADYAVYMFLRTASEPMLMFYFPLLPLAGFILLDFVIGTLFAVYAVVKVMRINIIGAIRGL